MLFPAVCFFLPHHLLLFDFKKFQHKLDSCIRPSRVAHLVITDLCGSARRISRCESGVYSRPKAADRTQACSWISTTFCQSPENSHWATNVSAFISHRHHGPVCTLSKSLSRNTVDFQRLPYFPPPYTIQVSSLKHSEIEYERYFQAYVNFRSLILLNLGFSYNMYV